MDNQSLLEHQNYPSRKLRNNFFLLTSTLLVVTILTIDNLVQSMSPNLVFSLIFSWLIVIAKIDYDFMRNNKRDKNNLIATYTWIISH